MNFSCPKACLTSQSELNIWKTNLGWSLPPLVPRNLTFIRYTEKFLFIQFSHSVMSDSLQHHRLQHTRLPCLSPTPGICSNSCPSSWWCHPTISSSVIPFSTCLQPFPASGFFPMIWFFASGGQSIGLSALAISPSNEYSRLISFRIDWFDLLEVQGTLKSFLQHHSSFH